MLKSIPQLLYLSLDERQVILRGDRIVAVSTVVGDGKTVVYVVGDAEPWYVTEPMEKVERLWKDALCAEAGY